MWLCPCPPSRTVTHPAVTQAEGSGRGQPRGRWPLQAWGKGRGKLCWPSAWRSKLKMLHQVQNNIVIWSDFQICGLFFHIDYCIAFCRAERFPQCIKHRCNHRIQSKTVFIVEHKFARPLDEQIKSTAAHLIKSWYGLLSVNVKLKKRLCKYEICMFCLSLWMKDAVWITTHNLMRGVHGQPLLFMWGH